MIRNEHEAFRNAARKAGISFRERFSFNTLFNGLSIRVNSQDHPKLSRLDGVKAIYPVTMYVLPKVTKPESTISPQDIFSSAMIGADIAQSELGFTGEGIRVGIIDTGIDYHHPDLGGGFGPGYRVFTGWDFVGDNWLGWQDDPVPDPEPYEGCWGHGTFGAGIVGANGGIKGVAPGVRFGAYKVFSCQSGLTSSDIIIAAMERALADKMQIVNISIGGFGEWPQFPDAQAATRLVNKGVVVVASIGNSGEYGLYAGGSPAVGSKVIGVASFDNTHFEWPSFTISPDDKAIAYYLDESTSLPPPKSGSALMARTGTSTSTTDACSALPAGSLIGKVALIRRGGCYFNTKAYNAQNAGAAAVVIYNNVPGAIYPSVSGDYSIVIPAVGISDTDGLLIDSRLTVGPVTLTWVGIAIVPNQTAGLISPFSSWGVAPDLSLKPDLGAPGGLIKSTFPLGLDPWWGDYTYGSGTSFSAPHVAGAAALLLQAKPHTPAQAVGTILQNSAQPHTWEGNPGLGLLDCVHRQGAGMLRIDNAILSTTMIEPGDLSLGESEFGPVSRTLTIVNKGSKPVTYELSNLSALATGPDTFNPQYFIGPASVTFSRNTITIPAWTASTVDVTISPDSTLPDRSLYGGYITFTPKKGGQLYRVPYAGFKGDYQSIPVLTQTPSFSFPWLAKLIGEYLYKQGDGVTFTMQGDDVPYVIYHLNHAARRFNIQIYEAKTGRYWGNVYKWEYMPRDQTPEDYWTPSFDGITKIGQRLVTVPDGEYVITFIVQKALGDLFNPAHFETWTSPTFKIKRN